MLGKNIRRNFLLIAAFLITGIFMIAATPAVSSAAFDPHNVTFYTYGDFYAVKSGFTKLSLIFSDPEYKGLFFTIIALSIFIAGFSHYISALKGKTQPNIFAWAVPLIFAFMMYAAFIVPKSNVMIDDRAINKTWVVGGIPMGVAVIAGISSGIEDDMIKMIDTASTGSPSDNISYEESAGGLGVDVLLNLMRQGAQINDPLITRSLDRYIQDCFVFYMGSAATAADWKDLREGKDDFMTILKKANNPAIYTVRYDNTNPASGRTLTCRDAWTALQTDLNTAIGPAGLFQDSVKTLCQSSGMYDPNTGGAATSQLQHCKDVTMDYLAWFYNDNSSLAAPGGYLGGNWDMLHYLRQQYIAERIYNEARTGDPSLPANYMISSRGTSAGIVINNWIPTIRGIIIALSLGLFPFLILLLPSPLYKTVISVITGLFLFIVLWGVIDAVAHSYLVDSAGDLFASVKQHGVGLRSFLYATDPLTKAASMWGYVRMIALTIAGALTGLLVKTGGYAFTAIGGALAGEAAATANNIGLKSGTPEGQASMMQSSIGAAGMQTIANGPRQFSFGEQVRDLANNMAASYGAGAGYKDSTDAYNVGKTKTEISAGQAEAARNAGIKTKLGTRNFARLESKMGKQKLVDEMKHYEDKGLSPDQAVNRIAGSEAIGQIVSTEAIKKEQEKYGIDSMAETKVFGFQKQLADTRNVDRIAGETGQTRDQVLQEEVAGFSGTIGEKDAEFLNRATGKNIFHAGQYVNWRYNPKTGKISVAEGKHGTSYSDLDNITLLGVKHPGLAYNGAKLFGGDGVSGAGLNMKWNGSYWEVTGSLSKGDLVNMAHRLHKTKFGKNLLTDISKGDYSRGAFISVIADKNGNIKKLSMDNLLAAKSGSSVDYKSTHTGERNFEYSDTIKDKGLSRILRNGFSGTISKSGSFEIINGIFNHDALGKLIKAGVFGTGNDPARLTAEKAFAEGKGKGLQVNMVENSGTGAFYNVKGSDVKAVDISSSGNSSKKLDEGNYTYKGKTYQFGNALGSNLEAFLSDPNNKAAQAEFEKSYAGFLEGHSGDTNYIDALNSYVATETTGIVSKKLGVKRQAKGEINGSAGAKTPGGKSVSAKAGVDLTKQRTAKFRLYL